ncbi:Tetracyclin-resistance protein, partial [Operophtera brumata]
YEGKTPWYKHITVEPTMFFYMMAFMITNVIEQTYYVFQACTVNHNYSAEICYNISDYEEINKEVQVTVSTFHQWNGIASHVVPLLLAFFLGSYSDKRGRKFILLAGLVGKLYFSLMITINTMNGADLAIFAGCFAYIADVSSVKNRTLRVGILDVVYLTAMPTGIAIGNVLFNKVVNRSFTAMFAINTSLMVVATLYTFIFLKWQTTPEQKSLKEAGVTNPITDFLDVNNLTSTLRTLSKKRPNNRRLFLWLLLTSMAFYTFQRDERPVMYLYTSSVFKWDATTFSHFRTYLSILYVTAMLFGIPLMTKVLHWRDTATTDKLMYVGATAAALGPCVAPLIRSMTSKNINHHILLNKLETYGVPTRNLDLLTSYINT